MNLEESLRVGGDWRIVRHRGPASAHHQLAVDPVVARQVDIFELTEPALVLGSAQRPDVVDETAVAERELMVVRRRTGGGAVLLRPGAVVWIDLVLPADEPLVSLTPAEVAVGVGRRWAVALAGTGQPTAVHTGEPDRGEVARLCCFAGLGVGEVTLGGAKAVGLAQRRSRSGTRVQTLAMVGGDPGELASFLRLDAEERAAVTTRLRKGVAVVPTTSEDLVEAVVDSLR
jgi:lipoate-protein ligase A